MIISNLNINRNINGEFEIIGLLRKNRKYDIKSIENGLITQEDLMKWEKNYKEGDLKYFIFPFKNINDLMDGKGINLNLLKKKIDRFFKILLKFDKDFK